jgi:hypothetical protein
LSNPRFNRNNSGSLTPWQVDPKNAPLLKLWQRKVFDLLLAEGKIDQETIDQMTAWPHSGFSVDRSVYLPKGDVAGLERLAQYMVPPDNPGMRNARGVQDKKVTIAGDEHAVVNARVRQLFLIGGTDPTLLRGRGDVHAT